MVPNSGPTVASRTAMVIGNLVRSAAIGLRQTLRLSHGLEDPFTPEQFVAALPPSRGTKRPAALLRPL